MTSDNENKIEQIRSRLDSTLFVEAGAGTGKTFALVERVYGLIATGKAELSSIAAITFTELAASELKDRIRLRILQAFEDVSLPQEVRDRCEKALSCVDEATICTLHSFAKRIVDRCSFRIGLPVNLEVLDDDQSQHDLVEQWTRFCVAFYKVDQDTPEQVTVKDSIALGLSIHKLFEVAKYLRGNWDLIDQDKLSTSRSTTRSSCLGNDELANLLKSSLGQIEEIRKVAQDNGVPPGDTLAKYLEKYDKIIELLNTSDRRLDRLTTLRILAAKQFSVSTTRLGNKSHWPKNYLDQARTTIQEVHDTINQTIGAVKSSFLDYALDEIRKFTLEQVRRRCLLGQLDFHDLLVIAMRALEDQQIKAEVVSLWKYLLIDEFQDTDPIQVEIASLLSGGVRSDDPELFNWRCLEEGKLFFVGDPKQSIYRFRRANIEIYERVKSALKLQGKGTLVDLDLNRRSVPEILSWVNNVCGYLFENDNDGAQVQYSELRPYFRTASSSGLEALPGTQGPEVGRDDIHLTGHSVSTIGDVSDESILVTRKLEAISVAKACQYAVNSKWEVRTSHNGDPFKRVCTYDDIAILIEDRKILGHMTDQLSALGIPYKIESVSIAFSSKLIAELITVCRAIVTPRDELAVFAYLHTSIVGMSDQELFEFRQAGGRFDPFEGREEILSKFEAINRYLSVLGDLHHLSQSVPVNDLVGRVIRIFRVFELAVLESHSYRDTWIRLRYFLGLARNYSRSFEPKVDFSEGGQAGIVIDLENVLGLGKGETDLFINPMDQTSYSDGTLLGFVRWIQPQLSKRISLHDGSFFGDRDMMDPFWKLPSSAMDDSVDELALGPLPGKTSRRPMIPSPGRVRILTIHAAKGLEFPVVFVVGLGTAELSQSRDKVVRAIAGDCEVKLTLDPIDNQYLPNATKTPMKNEVATEEFANAYLRESVAGAAERVRLSYVAFTRARDHLVVSLYRSSKSILAQKIVEACTDRNCHPKSLDAELDLVPNEVSASDHSVRVPGSFQRDDLELQLDHRDNWVKSQESVLESVSRTRTVSASVLALEFAKRQFPGPVLLQEDESDYDNLTVLYEVLESRSNPQNDRVETDYSAKREIAFDPILSRNISQKIGQVVHTALYRANFSNLDITLERCFEDEITRGMGSQDRARIGGLIRSAFESTWVGLINRGAQNWREVYVSTLVGEVLVEGFIDLVVERDGLLWVIDYKTDRVNSDFQLDKLVKYYSVQCACYALALGTSTSRLIGGCQLVFLDGAGQAPREVEVEDLKRLMDELISTHA